MADSSLWSANDDACDRNGIESTNNNAVEQDGYPMDFYSKVGGLWTNYFDLKEGMRIVADGD